VRLLIIILYPIAKPIALVCTATSEVFPAHDDGVTYRKAELKTFVALGVEDKLADDELSLLGSVLEFSGKTVGSIMVSVGVPPTPLTLGAYGRCLPASSRPARRRGTHC
jgi:CBS domain containing-hemolysin-like protein